jgi:hypothetical protein
MIGVFQRAYGTKKKTSQRGRINSEDDCGYKEKSAEEEKEEIIPARCRHGVAGTPD